MSVLVGSHGDLKQPMRFHRRGDTSPCCSDLSLPTHLGPHHLPSPLLHNRSHSLTHHTHCLSTYIQHIHVTVSFRNLVMGGKISVKE